jgi:CheY-like chemotaxis protein
MNPEGPVALIVDDNDLNVALFQAMLNAFGWRTDVAKSGMTAFARLTTDSYSAVLLDYHMPGVKGDMVLEWMNENLPARPPVIVVTADDSDAARERFNTLDCNAYLIKPIRVVEMRDTLERVVKQAA